MQPIGETDYTSMFLKPRSARMVDVMLAGSFVRLQSRRSHWILGRPYEQVLSNTAPKARPTSLAAKAGATGVAHEAQSHI